MSERSQTVILWWSLVFTVIYAVNLYTLLGMVPPPSPTLAPAEVAAFYAEHAFQIKLGAVIASWTGAFLVPFSLVVGLQIARMEEGKPVWSFLAFGGGALSSIFLVLPPIFWGTAAFTATRAPEVTAVVNELANFMLVTTDQFYIFMVIPIVYVGLKAKPDPNAAFPRWLCWATVWFAVLGEAGAAGFMFRTGPFAWNGLFVFWMPFCVYFLWLIPSYYCMFAALKRQTAANQINAPQ